MSSAAATTTSIATLSSSTTTAPANAAAGLDSIDLYQQQLLAEPGASSRPPTNGFSDHGRTAMHGLLAAGDPHGAIRLRHAGQRRTLPGRRDC